MNEDSITRIRTPRFMSKEPELPRHRLPVLYPRYGNNFMLPSYDIGGNLELYEDGSLL